MTGLLSNLAIIAAATKMLAEIIFVLGILAVAFWQKDMIFWIISGIITILISTEWIDSYPGPVVALWALGVYQVLKGLLMALVSDKPSQGLSQFKELWRRALGK